MFSRTIIRVVDDDAQVTVSLSFDLIESLASLVAVESLFRGGSCGVNSLSRLVSPVAGEPAKRIVVWIARLSVVAIVGLTSSAGIAKAAERVNFDRDIRPILADACFTCHGPDSKKRATDLRFDVESSVFAERDEAVIVRGDSDRSVLIERIVSDDVDVKMPPPDAARQLAQQEIELLKRWIDQGAEYSNHWAFEKLTRPEFPTTANPAWAHNGIDHFVLAKLDALKLKPSSRAARETLIRRLSLDLTGLPPTPAEVDAFLADQSENAYEELVDRLLASERFGEHFAVPWLDAARYADSNGYQQDRTRTLWPWRDWVVRAFNDNKPFDEFTIDQIAGDLLPDATRDQIVATGFQRNHMLNGEGGRIAEESRVEYVVDRVETLGATWLGLTVGCGRCHDHKYDPFSQREFYQLFAYFNSIDESGRVDAGGNAKPVLAVPTDEQLERQSLLKGELAEAGRRLREASTPEKQRAWEAATLAELDAGKVQRDWLPLAVTKFVSEQGQTLSREGDGSLLLTGKNPDNDNYRFEVKPEQKTLTGLRIEAVPNAAFTKGGFARSDSGNFVLTQFTVEVLRDGASSRETVAIAKAEASFEQGGWPVANTLDGKPNTGWAVNNPADMTIPRQAMFVFREPLKLDGGATLIVTMKHESPHKFHNLSRFRLSGTSLPTPKLGDESGLSADAIAALRLGTDERNDAQKKALRELFEKRDPEVAAAHREQDAVKKRQGDLGNQIVQTMVMQDLKQPRETFVLVRGVWNQPDKEQPIVPGTPSILPPLPSDAPANRLALAKWLVSSENPLTPRVVVNRFWQQMFGQGLVTTPEDFGVQGERPSHPELLEWLAVEFIESGWDVKRLLKTIVMSSTYQQSSVATPERLEADPSNRWLSRAPRFRLSSLGLRDQALALSGLLVEQTGGPPVKPYQPPGIWADLSLGKIKYQQDSGDMLYRRSLYTFWRRASAPTMLFDVASRQVCQVRVNRTNTPLHALVSLNDVTYIEAARKMAERILSEGGASDESRLAYAFRLATARFPGESERTGLQTALTLSQEYFQQTPDAASELLQTGDSKVNPVAETVELAAWTAVCNVVLNLDETLNRE